jgi:hypothetical protein
LNRNALVQSPGGRRAAWGKQKHWVFEGGGTRRTSDWGFRIAVLWNP